MDEIRMKSHTSGSPITIIRTLILVLPLVVCVQASCPQYCQPCFNNTDSCCAPGLYWNGSFTPAVVTQTTVSMTTSNVINSNCVSCSTTIDKCENCTRSESVTTVNLTCTKCANELVFKDNRCVPPPEEDLPKWVVPVAASVGGAVAVGIVLAVGCFLYHRRPKASRPMLPTVEQLDWPPPENINGSTPKKTRSVFRGRSRYTRHPISAKSSDDKSGRDAVPSVCYETTDDIVPAELPHSPAVIKPSTSTTERQPPAQLRPVVAKKKIELRATESIVPQPLVTETAPEHQFQSYQHPTADDGEIYMNVESTPDLTDTCQTALDSEEIYVNTADEPVSLDDHPVANGDVIAADEDCDDDYTNFEELQQERKQSQQPCDDDDDDQEVYMNVEVPKPKPKPKPPVQPPRR